MRSTASYINLPLLRGLVGVDCIGRDRARMGIVYGNLIMVFWETSMGVEMAILDGRAWVVGALVRRSG